MNDLSTISGVKILTSNFDELKILTLRRQKFYILIRLDFIPISTVSCYFLRVVRDHQIAGCSFQKIRRLITSEVNTYVKYKYNNIEWAFLMGTKKGK